MSWQGNMGTIAERVIPKGECDLKVVEAHIKSGDFVAADGVLRKWLSKINMPGGVQMEPEHAAGLRRALENMEASAPRASAA